MANDEKLSDLMPNVIDNAGPHPNTVAVAKGLGLIQEKFGEKVRISPRMLRALQLGENQAPAQAQPIAAEQPEAAPAESQQPETAPPAESAPPSPEPETPVRQAIVTETAAPPPSAKPVSSESAGKEPAKPDASTTETWQRRYETLAGKYTAELRRARAENDEMRAQLSGLQEELEAIRKERAALAQAAEEMRQQLDAAKPSAWDQVEDLSPETIQAIRQGVRGEADAVIKDLREQVAALQQRLQQFEPVVTSTSLMSLETALDRSVPGWRVVNADPHFVDVWLNEADPLSGEQRYALLRRAMAAQAHDRVAALFRAYMREFGAPSSEDGKAKSGAPAQVVLTDLSLPDAGQGSSPPTSSPSAPRDDLAEVQDYVNKASRGVVFGRDQHRAMQARLREMLQRPSA